MHPGRHLTSIFLAFLITLPGLVVRLGHIELSHPLAAFLFGLSIVGAAFMLSWAAEVAQLDISAGLAIAVLAFIAVLPEYAVDLVFAWKAGGAVAAYGGDCRPPGYSGESPCSLALANMTGANRLLIGIGWSMVVFVAWYRSRGRGIRLHEVALERSHSIELAYLAVATAYSLTLPLKESVTLLDAAVLVGIFVAYTVPHRLGPGRGAAPGRPRLLPRARSRRGPRRAVVIAALRLRRDRHPAEAEHFAEALVGTGRDFQISEFLLVQWLAPLASEAPELLVAGLYAWRLNTNAGLGTLVSSKVNQWTLLVGTLPIVFAVASGSLQGLPVEPRQREELLLTAAQSVFARRDAGLAVDLAARGRAAVRALLRPVRHRRRGARAVARRGAHRRLGGLPRPGAGILAQDRRLLPALIRDGFRTPHAPSCAPTRIERGA